MEGRTKRLASILGLIVVIGACGTWLTWYSTTPTGFVPPSEPEWQCTQCGHRFFGPMAAEPADPARVLELGVAVARRRCPKCGGAAGQRLVRACTKCGTFFAYVVGMRPRSSGEGFEIADEAVSTQCVNVQCRGPVAEVTDKRPEGHWRACRCTRCGKRLDVLLPDDPGAGDEPSHDIRCFDAACGAEAVPD